MYSYADRIRAVELYIKLGKRLMATIRQLGYPTKNALRGWHREYEQRLDLPVGCAVRAPKFTQAQKEAAVEHYRVEINIESSDFIELPGWSFCMAFRAWVWAFVSMALKSA